MGLPPWPWAAFSFPLLSSLGGSTGSAGVWGSVPRLNRVLHRRAHRRAPCVGTTVPWASWGFGCSVALRGPCGVLGGRIWLKGHRVVALAGSGTSPRQHERSVLLAFSHLRPERIGLPARRGRERGGLGSSSLWLWPRAWLAGGALPPVTRGPEEPANGNLKIARPGGLLRPQSLFPAAQDPSWPPPPVLLPAGRGPATHSRLCPTASLPCRPAGPGPSGLPRLCPVELRLLLRLGLCHASRDPLHPETLSSSLPCRHPGLQSPPAPRLSHGGGALGCWSEAGHTAGFTCPEWCLRQLWPRGLAALGRRPAAADVSAALRQSVSGPP